MICFWSLHIMDINFSEPFSYPFITFHGTSVDDLKTLFKDLFRKSFNIKNSFAMFVECVFSSKPVSSERHMLSHEFMVHFRIFFCWFSECNGVWVLLVTWVCEAERTQTDRGYRVRGSVHASDLLGILQETWPHPTYRTICRRVSKCRKRWTAAICKTTRSQIIGNSSIKTKNPF